jgi:hypothetical protein
VLSEAEAGTLEVENVPFEPKLEERTERTVPREWPVPKPGAVEAERAPEHEGGVPEPEPQPEQAIVTAELEASEVEPEPVTPPAEAESAAPALAHAAAIAEPDTVVPEAQTELATAREPAAVVIEPERGPERVAATTQPELEPMVAEAQPVVLDVPPEPIAPRERREPMPPTVPVPTITSPLDGAAIRAQNLVISGNEDSNFTVQLLDWGALVADTVAKTDGTWSISLPQTHEGEHLYSARALDGVGRTSAQSRLLTLTVVPPSPAEPVRFERAERPPRERPREAVVSPPAPGSPVRRLSLPRGAPTAGAAVIVLASLGLFVFVHPLRRAAAAVFRTRRRAWRTPK